MGAEKRVSMRENSRSKTVSISNRYPPVLDGLRVKEGRETKSFTRGVGKLIARGGSQISTRESLYLEQ